MRRPERRGADREPGTATGRSCWVAAHPELIFAVLHMPPGKSQTARAALVLPMFGWDNDCSYRARREWATRLAEAGVAAARIDFPGTENSVGSPLAPGRAESWISATADAARWLRAISGCQRLTAIGVGLGGLVAYQAVLASAPIDDLIIWAARASGQAYLRELRAYAAVASGELADPPEAPRSDGVINIAGHMMSSETAAALNALDLSTAPLPQAHRRRVLLIGRDGHGIDRRLRSHLEGSGADLTLLESDDFHRLVALPELRMTPDKTISASIAWLQEASADAEPIAHAQTRAVPSTTTSIEFEYGDASVRERICELDTASGRLVAIVSEPAVTATPASYCLLGINSGELRHTGPNRILVEVARRAAASGVPMVRVDLPGLGDSDGDSVRTYARTFDDDARVLGAIEAIYDELAPSALPNRFVAVGLCLGGYFAIRALLESERSVGAIAINPPTFRWTRVQQSTLRRALAALAPEEVAPQQHRNRLPRALQPAVEGIQQALRKTNLEARRRLAHWAILWRLARRRSATDARRAVERLAESNAPVLLLLSTDESVLRLLEQASLAAKVARARNIEVAQLPTSDHILRPLTSQEVALEHISAALREFVPSQLDGTNGPEG